MPEMIIILAYMHLNKTHSRKWLGEQTEMTRNNAHDIV